jgi:hypothetical protein
MFFFCYPKSISGVSECEVPFQFGFNFFLGLDEINVVGYYDAVADLCLLVQVVLFSCLHLPFCLPFQCPLSLAG